MVIATCLVLVVFCRSGTSTYSEQNSDSKDRVVYVDEPLYSNTHSDSVPGTVPNLVSTPIYIPEYTEVLINPADVNMSTLNLNFGDNYTESYCSPRAFTLDLSDGIGAKDNKFFLVMVLRAEGDSAHRYRLAN